VAIAYDRSNGVQRRDVNYQARTATLYSLRKFAGFRRQRLRKEVRREYERQVKAMEVEGYGSEAHRYDKLFGF
jgi:hypothetical protein